MAVPDTRKPRRSRSIRSVTADPQNHALTEAKTLALQIVAELSGINCPLAVMGTALAIVVGAIAAQVDFLSRESFYEQFVSAAHESEFQYDRVIESRRLIH